MCWTSSSRFPPHADATAFEQKAQHLTTLLTEQSQKIEQEKLRVMLSHRFVEIGLCLCSCRLQAIGQRNKVTAEIDNRKQQQAALEAAISQKQAELERYECCLFPDMVVSSYQLALSENNCNGNPCDGWNRSKQRCWSA